MSVRLSTTAIAVLAIVSAACGPESSTELYDTASVSQASCNPEYQQCGESCEDLGTCPVPKTCIDLAHHNATGTMQHMEVYGEVTDSTGAVTSAAAYVVFGEVAPAAAATAQKCRLSAASGERIRLRTRNLLNGASTSTEMTVGSETLRCTGTLANTAQGAYPGAICARACDASSPCAEPADPCSGWPSDRTTQSCLVESYTTYKVYHYCAPYNGQACGAIRRYYVDNTSNSCFSSELLVGESIGSCG